MFLKKISKKKLKCNFYFEASEYSLMLKLTKFVIASTMQEPKINWFETEIQILSWALSRTMQ